MRKPLIAAMTAFILLAACSKKDQQAGENAGSAIENIYKDEKMVKIAELQDKRDVEGLIPLMKAKDEKYRVRAALAHGSIRDPEALPYLYLMLQTDKEVAPRKAAAWAIGQIGDEEATNELLKAVGMELDYTVLGEILESIGKCANDSSLKFMQNFNNTNPTLTGGHAAGIFRSVFKIGADSTLVAHCMDYINSSHADTKTKFFAANYLGRVRPYFYNNDLDSIVNYIADPVTSDSIRLPLLMSITFTEVREGQFIEMLEGCRSFTSRVGYLRLLLSNPAIEFAREDLFLNACNIENNEMKARLHEIGFDYAVDYKVGLVFEELPVIEHKDYWPIYKKAGITSKAEWNDNEDWESVLETAYESANTPYAKVRFIEALEGGQWNSLFWFRDQWTNDSLPQIVRNAALQAALKVDLTTCLCNAEYEIKGQMIMEALRSGDVGAQSLASYKIEEEGFTESPFYDMRYANTLLPLIDSVRKNKSLPMEQETWYDLTRARNNISGTKSNFPEPSFNHPVNWNEVKEIPVAQEVMIETNKGNIKIRLYVNEAPGTVWNFLELVDSGFYDKKYFHRVIPNFVIQGGDPRGDGWGGLEWSQRSEFNPSIPFVQGAVGIASAGPDTEGVQFFITHCPVPHLDGRYTVFAVVTEGMDVVQEISVGDTINKVYRID